MNGHRRIQINFGWKKISEIAIFLIVAVTRQDAYADFCPQSPTKTAPTIQAKVSYDSKSHLYIYSYTLSNGNKAPLAIERLIMPVASSVGAQQFHAPAHWSADVVDRESSPASPDIVWDTAEPDPRSMDLTKPPQKLGMLPSQLYAIKPGAQLSGFSFMSKQPPGAQEYFVEGDTQGMPVGTPNAADDEPNPNCPGFTGSLVDSGVVGITIGPVSPGTISLSIRLRDADNDRTLRTIRPDEKGNIGVLVRGSASFDPSLIDVSSVTFGLGSAKPVSSKLINDKNSGHEVEREDWERTLLGIQADKNTTRPEKKSQNKDLFLLFNLKTVGVRCGADRALFLTGQTTDKAPILGGVSIQTTDCDEDDRKSQHDRKKQNK